MAQAQKHLISRGVVIGVDEAPGPDLTVIHIHVGSRRDFDRIELPLVDQGQPAPAVLKKAMDHGRYLVEFSHRVSA